MSKVFEAMRRVSRMCNQGDSGGYVGNATMEWLLTHGYFVESVVFNPERTQGPYIIVISEKPPRSHSWMGFGKTYSEALLDAADAIAQWREAETGA